MNLFRPFPDGITRIGRPFSGPQRTLRQLVGQTSPLRVVLGAGPTQFPGWVATDVETLNLLLLRDWKLIFGRRRVDALLAEHVWEHLSLAEAAEANRNCFRFVKPGGYLRLAVPDALHPDPAYREWVRPGGSGAGADEHKVFYDYQLLSTSLQQAGFEVKLLEYWDEKGQFHFTDWSSADGHVTRSKRFDPRNRNGSLTYTSLIADALKP